MRDNAIGGAEVIDQSLTNYDLGPDSVGYSEMLDNAVGNAEMRDNAIGSAEVINGSLTGSDIENGTVEQADLNGIRMYVTQGQIDVNASGEGCKTFTLPTGRFTQVPHVFVVRSAIGSWEDSGGYAQARFIETTVRSTSSVKICVHDDLITSGQVGVAILAIQTD